MFFVIVVVAVIPRRCGVLCYCCYGGDTKAVWCSLLLLLWQ